MADKLRQFTAPDGSVIEGTLETISGCANITGWDADGNPQYQGSTEIFWDEQKTVRRDDKIVYLDEGGNEWTFDQLVEVKDEDEEGE